MRKVRIISRSYCLIWMDIHALFATKLLGDCGRDDSSTTLALGLRILALSIETTEKKGGVFSFFFSWFSSLLVELL